MDRVETLLEHATFLRNLARALVCDGNTSDDVVQDTWHAALKTPPVDTGADRAWLARVLRNIVTSRRRQDASRRHRERAAARREALPSAQDLSDRVVEGQRVLNAVVRLEEPYLSTILYRYFEDFSVRQIAEHHQVSVETVRTRLKRARERLRAELELDRGESAPRALWLLAGFGPNGAIDGRVVSTASGLSSAGVVSAWLAGGIMTAKHLAAAAVFIALIGAWFVLRTSDSTALKTPVASRENSLALPFVPGASESASIGEPDSPSASEESEPTEAGLAVEAEIRGRVVDEDGKSIPNADVHLVVNSERRGRASTNGTGEFVLAAPSGQLVELEIEAGCYETLRTMPTLSVNMPTEFVLNVATLLEICVAFPDSMVMPKVYDLRIDGDGGSASAHYFENGSNSATSNLATRTSDKRRVSHPSLKAAETTSGVWRICDIEPGLYVASVSFEGIKAPPPQSAQVELGIATRLRFEIEPIAAPEIVVRVVDSKGKPLEDVQVSKAWSNFSSSNQHSVGATDSRGEYKLSASGRGLVELLFTKTGYALSSCRLKEPFAAGVVTIELASDAALWVTARNADGDSMEDVSVVVENFAVRTARTLDPAWIAGAQSFRVDGVCPGWNSVHVNKDRATLASVVVFIESGETQTVEVAVPAAIRVNGRVLIDGEPLESAYIRISLANVPFGYGHDTDMRGEFTLDFHGSGLADLLVRVPSIASFNVPVSIVEGEPLLIELETELLNGIVVGANGEPVPNVQISVESATVQNRFEADAEGRIVDARLPAGSYSWTMVGPSKHGFGCGQFVVLAGSAVEVRFELEPARSIEIKFDQPRRTFTHFQGARWVDGQWIELPTPMGTIFKLPWTGVEAGKLRIDSAVTVPVLLDVPAGAELPTLHTQIQLGSPIELIVVSPELGPLGGHTVQIAAENSQLLPPPLGHMRTNTQGRIRVALHPGNYTATTTLPGGRIVSRKFSVYADRPIPLLSLP
ncbi:MAG: sigma-70 family RNA polymerase sigma factor [Planctomycetota bacterium]